MAETYPDALVIGGEPATRVLIPNGVHPLLAAVGQAFADHRPLTLSPDAVWLTITQGVAQHIRLHAEKLRSDLVSHSGKKELAIAVNGPMPRDAESWRDISESFGKLLLSEAKHADVFECDFTTSTEVDRVAGRVVMMDAYSPYFSYWIRAVCGIPRITLTGTVQDWRKIRERVDRLADFGLDKWCESLVPITDQFARAASGDVDVAFWQRIYNPVDAYGGKLITGWATRFYPYLNYSAALNDPNEMLDLPIDEPKGLTSADQRWYTGPGLRSSAVPATLSKVAIRVNDQAAGENLTVALHAGLVGVTQDDDGALRPISGWHLMTAEPQIDDIVDRILRDHVATAPEPSRRRPVQGSSETVALFERIGTASLFGGAWRVLPIHEHRTVFRGFDLLSINTVIELADGRTLGEARSRVADETYWVVGRVVPEVLDGPIQLMNGILLDNSADVPVYGSSLAMLLDVALETGGDISRLETGRLSQLDG